MPRLASKMPNSLICICYAIEDHGRSHYCCASWSEQFKLRNCALPRIVRVLYLGLPPPRSSENAASVSHRSKTTTLSRLVWEILCAGAGGRAGGRPWRGRSSWRRDPFPHRPKMRRNVCLARSPVRSPDSPESCNGNEGSALVDVHGRGRVKGGIGTDTTG